MKTIITLDRANQPYGYPQLDGSGSLQATGSLFGTASYALNSGGPIVPTSNDFRTVNSYNKWAFGNVIFGPGADEDKFTAIANGYEPTDYLTLEVYSGTVNGKSISMNPTQSVTVTSASLVYRDDGLGLAPVSYTDFINEVFASHSIYTRLTGSNSLNYQANFCKVDRFAFVFKETGQVTSGSTPITYPFYYAIGSEDYGITIHDRISGDLGIITATNQYWT